MRMREFIYVLVLLPGAAAQAVNTTATLGDKSWTPSSQQTLIGQVGPLNERPDVLLGQVPDAHDLTDGGPLPTLYAYPELSSLSLAEPAAVLGSSRKASASVSVIDSINDATNLAAGPQWSGDSKEYSGVGGHAGPVALTEMDGAAMALPTVKELSVMEVAVFPTLGALVVVFLSGMLIIRVRQRRQASRAQQLLQI